MGVALLLAPPGNNPACAPRGAVWYNRKHLKPFKLFAMSETVIRHIIAVCGTLVALLIYWAGFSAGRQGWWWTVFGMVFIYLVIFKLVNAEH